MSAGADAATQVAREYYNSHDADNFYAEVWGGEDIHVGLYQSPTQPIREASRLTVDHMADRLVGLDESSTVLDIGAGYGGAARRLVERFGCKVVCVNLSEIENERNRKLNEETGVADKIEVIDGSFEELPFDNQSFDAAWSQDAILHAGNRCRVLGEVDRVLRPGKLFVFTDPMQSDDCPEGVLEPILARIHLADLGSPKFYRSVAADLGWKDEGYEDHTHQLVNHYSRVLETTNEYADRLSGKVSDAYLERMRAGLKHWIEGGQQGHLAWGVFLFSKPA
jgi:sarcosine/dimethylglycine N-methyltransferase